MLLIFFDDFRMFYGLFLGKGDSGAGFVVRSPTSSFKIIGIVSASLLRQDENCRPDNYVVFTNVPIFVDWILKEIDREKEIRCVVMSFLYHNP